MSYTLVILKATFCLASIVLLFASIKTIEILSNPVPVCKLMKT
jgi:hypothetical protein